MARPPLLAAAAATERRPAAVTAEEDRRDERRAGEEAAAGATAATTTREDEALTEATGAAARAEVERTAAQALEAVARAAIAMMWGKRKGRSWSRRERRGKGKKGLAICERKKKKKGSALVASLLFFIHARFLSLSLSASFPSLSSQPSQYTALFFFTK